MREAIWEAMWEAMREAMPQNYAIRMEFGGTMFNVNHNIPV